MSAPQQALLASAAASNNYIYWRINVSANDGNATFLAIAEIEMRAAVGGADQCTGGTATASLADAGFTADKAFDNDASTRWSVNSASNKVPNWISYQFTSAVNVAQYTIQAHPTDGTRSPKDWTLEKSTNGSTWTVADTRTGETGWTGGQIRTFTVP